MHYITFISEMPQKKRRQTKARSVRHRWTPEEIEEVLRIFKNFIAAKQTPGQLDVEKAMKKSKKRNGHIWKLKRDNIKKKVSWIICRSSREWTCLQDWCVALWLYQAGMATKSGPTFLAQLLYTTSWAYRMGGHPSSSVHNYIFIFFSKTAGQIYFKLGRDIP